MTITTRSKRVSEFGAGAHTPVAIGPGSYATEKLASSFRDVARPLFSGFATSEKRDLNANRTTSAITPGPGAYMDESSRQSPHAPSNAFATKASRFAPSAPGSTAFLASSIQDNPGPGSYHVGSSVSHPSSSSLSISGSGSNQSQSQELDARRAVNRFAHLVKPTAPAIPKREQSYGYVQVGPDLAPQAQPASIYSGMGDDTVGPAAYSGHHEIWNAKKNVAPSLRSTVKREVWAMNAPRANIPGPGHYYEDADASTTTDATALGRNSGLRGRKKGVKVERPSAVFASKVPIQPSAKSMAQYDAERDLELHEKDARQLERQRTSVQRANVGAFGSTTHRVELSSQQLCAPFSNPSFTETPGPGMYSDRTHAMRGSSNKKHRVPSSGSTNQHRQYRDDSLGFSSASERYCLTTSTKPAAPGPGAYKSETPRSLDAAMKAKRSVGRNGVFGTTSERRVWENLERLDADDLTPGPGAYDQRVETHAGHWPLASNSATFKSSSQRFTKQAHPHVHCVGEDVVPAVGQYDLALGHGAANSAGCSSPRSPQQTARGTGSSGASTANNGAGFLSKSERTVFDTRDARNMPGPGTYADDNDDATAKAVGVSGIRTRTHEVRASIGNEERFRVKPTVPDNVGPGAYSLPSSVGSKSFNVTMTTVSTSSQSQGRRS